MLQSGQNSPDDNTRRVKYLIQVFAVVLNTVDPIDMMPYLQCLSSEEMGQIRSCVDLTTNERGAIKMFSLLVLKGTTQMIAQLVDALRKTGGKTHKDVAEQLEDLQTCEGDCDDSGKP